MGFIMLDSLKAPKGERKGFILLRHRGFAMGRTPADRLVLHQKVEESQSFKDGAAFNSCALKRSGRWLRQLKFSGNIAKKI